MILESRKMCSVVSLLVMRNRLVDQCEPVIELLNRMRRVRVAHVLRHVNAKCWVYRTPMTVVVAEIYLLDVWK